jgi:hypothetical protein
LFEGKEDEEDEIGRYACPKFGALPLWRRRRIPVKQSHTK